MVTSNSVIDYEMSYLSYSPGYNRILYQLENGIMYSFRCKNIRENVSSTKKL